MKRFVGSLVHGARDYWIRLMHSAKNNKISRGAANFVKSMSTAFKDNWRRKNEKKPPQK
jgi:hypothetical protein